MTTVTEIVDALFPFDRDGVAAKVAARRKTSTDEILQEWEEKRETGTAHHAALQKLVEAKIQGEDAYEDACEKLPDNQQFLVRQLNTFLAEHCQEYTLHKAELRLESKGVKGIVDTVLKTPTGTFVFCEWKLGSKLWMKSFDGQKALGVLSEIDNCKYQKGNFQVTFYESLAADNDMTVDKSFIVHFDPSKDKCTPLRSSNKMRALVRDAWQAAEAGNVLETFLSSSPETDAQESSETTDSSGADEDVMVDLETLSTSPNSHILTIGAIRFARSKTTKKLEQMDAFYRRISFESNDLLNRHKSSPTITWWMEQTKDARKEAFAKSSRVELRRALEDFISWFGDSKYLWCHGAAFDAVILEDAMRQCGLEPPFKYWNVRDTRTVYDLHKIELRKHKSGTAHHALHDCYSQIEALRNAF